jgi:hypothetical protein
MAAASRAAACAVSRALPKRVETIAEKGRRGRGKDQIASDSDNDDELEDGTSSSSSSEIARKQNASDKHAKLAAELQTEKSSIKTGQASIDNQRKVNAA